jgi:hypothetical protein
MAPRLSTKIPKWFNPDDYSVVREFDTREWAQMVTGRRNWLWELEKRKPSKFERVDFWEAYLAEVSPSRPPTTLVDRRTVDKADRKTPKAVIDVTKAFHSEDFRSEIEWDIAHGARLLLVDPRAPDALLQQQFFERVGPAPIKKRGPTAANFEVTKDTLKAWADGKLLEVWHLDFYHDVFEQPRLRPDVLCKAVGVVSNDPEEWANSARDKARDLIKGKGLIFDFGDYLRGDEHFRG